MARTFFARWLRVAGAAALVTALSPVSGTPAQASQGGDDHSVTICHRTNSEKNPYVEITIDKAAVFQQGHDTHDEGPVWQPGFKAAGKRWGDIIPPFTFYASPQDQRDGNLSEYPGLNWTEGQSLYNNGCQPTTPPPPQQEQPFGELDGRCIEGRSPAFGVDGSFDNGDVTSTVSWRLALSTGTTIALTTSPFQQTIDAPVGTTVMLQYHIGEGVWTDADGPETVTDCPPARTSGGFTVVCDADGAVVTIGSLSGPEGTSWVLRVNGVEQPVSAGQVVQVPGGASLVLLSVRNGTKTSRQATTAPEACPERGTVTKSSAPASGSVIAPGTTIDYTVTVTNTGQIPLTAKPVVDTLPSFVTVTGSPSDGGVVSADGRTITWTVTLAPGTSKTLTYKGLVSAEVPAGTSLVNSVTFLGQTATTTHTVGSRTRQLTKAVSPTGTAAVGDTLTYTLTVTTGGNLGQTAVVVTDDIPAGTTYVLGSAVCVGPGDCGVTVANGTVTWTLGEMAAGTSRSVQFAVVIAAPPAGTAPVDLVNVGAVRSAEVATQPSNQVVTPVAQVLGVKQGPGTTELPGTTGGPLEVAGTQTGVLPRSGPGQDAAVLLGLAALAMLLGFGLVRAARPVRVESRRPRRPEVI